MKPLKTGSLVALNCMVVSHLAEFSKSSLKKNKKTKQDGQILALASTFERLFSVASM